MSVHVHTQDAAGIAIGASCGFVKGLVAASSIHVVLWGAIYDTAILAAVGAVVGFVVTSFLRWVKKSITK